MKRAALIRAGLCVALLGAAGCAQNAKPPTTIEGQRRAERQQLIEDALLFVRMGDATRAEQYLNAAVERGADERKVFPILLSVCIRDKRYRAAAEYAENYLRKHPTDHRVRFVLATLYVGLGDTEPAREQFERLLAGRPGHADAHFAYAVLLRDYARDHAAADRHFRAYLTLRPSGAHREEAEGSLLSRVP